MRKNLSDLLSDEDLDKIEHALDEYDLCIGGLEDVIRAIVVPLLPALQERPKEFGL